MNYIKISDLCNPKLGPIRDPDPQTRFHDSFMFNHPQDVVRINEHNPSV